MKLQPMVLEGAGVGCVLLALFALVFVMASAPTPAASRLGIRGLKRARSLKQQQLWAQSEPLVRWVAGRIAPLLTQRFRTSLDRNIVLAGDTLGLIPEEYVALCIIGATFGAALGGVSCAFLHKPAVWIALSAIVSCLLPWLQISGEAAQRARRVQDGLPYVVDLISLSLSAGLDFPGALRQVLDKSSDPSHPMMEEIGFILQELLIGKTRRQALLTFNSRCPYEAVTEFVGAVVQAEERGNPLAEILHVQATSSRARRSVRAEEAAAKAGLKILVPCMFVFISVLLLIVGPLFMTIGPAFGGM
jgi:tight adherence protein C